MKVVATDLDRTLLPNGPDPDDGSLPLFKKLIAENGITPIFVTARRFDSIKKVMEEYDVPTPEAIIASVGSAIYLRQGEEYVEHPHWKTSIAQNAQGWNRKKLEQALLAIDELVLQGEEEQNPFKLSYYLYDLTAFDRVTPRIEALTASVCGFDAEVTLSKDFNNDLTYIDIMPTSVSKLTALEFLQKEMGFQREQLLFAGDSGNDMAVVLSHFNALLVGNAEEVLKEEARQKKEAGFLYLPKGQYGLNGNYSSGIIEALVDHGWIDEKHLLQKSDFSL